MIMLYTVSLSIDLSVGCVFLDNQRDKKNFIFYKCTMGVNEMKKDALVLYLCGARI